ncbi:NAD(P)-dependent oxidoreductase [Cryptosporangium arvum]|uniref:NAD(P)-dependent oxidoreductase n=1 Tax=Cryptosporangium arvum TaxID=80871 RepID=UPI0007C54E3C|nr:NAD(P)-dependent oxidoreductase [Cryptosporangium arvum]
MSRIAIYGCGPDEADAFRAMAPRFGVEPIVIEAPVGAGNSGLAAGSRCVSVDHRTRLTAPVLRALSRAGVGYVSTRSVGVDHIDTGFAARAGIVVGTVPYSPDSVADYTLMLMLMAVRNAKAMVLRAEVHDYRLNDVRGRELRDLTIGVVGTGRIGSAVITRLSGFGARILAHDVARDDSVPLDDLLRESDLVTLHVPLTAATRHLLDRARLDRCKPGVILVNTARGALLDTEALLAALESGRVAGAALDVVDGEDGIFSEDRRDTPIGNKPLLRLQELPTVVVSPHTAYYTDHGLRDVVENTLVNCRNFESGEQ